MRAEERIREDQPMVSKWRQEIPSTGLREYWYPAVQAEKVGKGKPVGVRLLGEDLVFFLGDQGHVVALEDLCPHRGGKLSGGVCHFSGTVTCPYHGWTFDAEGKCVAALIEGPDSVIPGLKIRVPTRQVREFRGIVWVWIGDGEPVPVEEDVPPEFLDESLLVLTETRPWPINWRPLIENGIDGHAPYVHRNSVLALLYGMPPFGQKLTPTVTHDGKGLALLKESFPPPQSDYPGLGRFPKRLWRKYWAWAVPSSARRKSFTGKPYTQEVLLPGMTRIDYGTHLYIRWAVPVDESGVRNFYWHLVRGSKLAKWWFCVRYYFFRRWAMNWNFSEQDRKVVGTQNYSAPEKLSWTDAVIIQWRKLVLEGYHVERVKRTLQAKTKTAR